MTPRAFYACLRFPVFLGDQPGQRYVGGFKIPVVFYVRIVPPEHTVGASLGAMVPACPAWPR